MALSGEEIEAKIAALENRVSLLAQNADGLEFGFQYGVSRWTEWAMELKLALTVIGNQIEKVSGKIPLPRQKG